MAIQPGYLGTVEDSPLLLRELLAGERASTS
jgi:hypothetical protein